MANDDVQPASDRRMSRRPRPEDAPLETVSHVPGPAGDIEVVTQGTGRPIVIVHGGTGNRTSWEGVADQLAAFFSVLRYTRPTYRLAPPARGAAAVEIEVAEARAVATSAREPVVLVGHSSGAAVAIEAALADPRPFAALVLYEPPLDVTHGVKGAAALHRARAALDDGHPVRAMRIHLTDLVGMPRPLTAVLMAMPPARRLFADFAEGQIADDEMLDALPVGLQRFAGVELPVLLITGAKSPRHLRDRSAQLAAVLPRSPEQTDLMGQAHAANDSAPDVLAEAVAAFVARLPT
ncbi:alpha/beta fold hydrolase [Microbacterium sp. B2969]|uniref:Alpha/beta fold hydrolase n=1 Tax=Microbacterium alkaliflavum TaxID=3248839 RepID=A0ABW7Q6H0_9MICO